jgi:Tol biopolymer transport system component
VAIGDQELFYRKGTDLIAQPFDSSSLTLSGNPRVLSNHVSMVAAGGPTLVYFDPPGGLSQGHRITWLSRSGTVLSTTGSVSTFRDPKISPDEQSLAIAQANDSGVFGITKYDIARNIDTRITGATFAAPAWSPDSRSIISGDGIGLHRFDASASGAPQMIRTSKILTTVLDISPDGREAVIRSTESVKSRLSVMPLDGSSDPRPILAELVDSLQAAFSPDGKWIAVAVTEGATARLHVQPHPGPGPKIPVTAMGAMYPRWRGDGRELYFLTRVDGEFAIMAVPVTWNGGIPDFGAVQTLFKVPNMVPANYAFDVTHDGQKFVAIVAGDLDPSPLTMVVRAAVR